MELECSVTYKAVLYGYEGLKLARKKELNATSLEGVKMAKASKSTEDGVPREQEVKKSQDRDTWNQYSNSSNVDKVPVTDGNSSLEARDSFKINLHRMSSKSNNSVCYDDYIEAEGEFLALPTLKEFTPRKTPKTQNVFVVQEEINFLQTGLLIQVNLPHHQRSLLILKLPSF